MRLPRQLNHNRFSPFQRGAQKLLRNPISSLRCSMYYSYTCASRLELGPLATLLRPPLSYSFRLQTVARPSNLSISTGLDARGPAAWALLNRNSQINAAPRTRTRICTSTGTPIGSRTLLGKVKSRNKPIPTADAYGRPDK